MTINLAKGKLKMFKKAREKSKMSELAFVSMQMREVIAPKGSVKERIRTAARRLHWTHCRTTSLWYADERASVKPSELREIEQASGVRYAQDEIRTVNEMLARADALLDGPDADFHRPFVAAFRAFVSALDRPRASGDE
jgi:hypothetical protein